jgi:hypothetical protein
MKKGLLGKKKLPTKKVIKSIASFLELYLSYGEAVRLIEIHRELDNRGYRAFDEKSSGLIREALGEMGWKIRRLV